MNFFQTLKDYRFKIFYRLLVSRQEGLQRYGEGCAWTIDDRRLTPQSRILCAGAGHDISFEKALIARGCRVVLLDPSPTGIATVNRESLPESALQFLPIGLAGRDGDLSFAPPDDEKEGSFKEASAGAGATTFACRRLSTIMADLGWDRIDLLKMDIEGCEYEVLADIVQHSLKIGQICCEFHHGPAFGRSRMDTVRAIFCLRQAGFRLVHRVEWDHTFVAGTPFE